MTSREVMTVQQYREYLEKEAKNAGFARRTRCISKHFHPSRSEADYCNWLLARLHYGEIKAFKWQDSVPLHIYFKGRKSLWKNWKIDFVVTEMDGSKSWHESKGWNRSDDNFKMKLAAFKLEYPKRPLYVNKALITSTRWKRHPSESYKCKSQRKTYRRNKTSV